MSKVYAFLFAIMLLCAACSWQLKTSDVDSSDVVVTIDRYDRVETLYLTTGDYAALQQMNISYPMQTRMLIEDMLLLGNVDEPDINTKLLRFFQDSTLQAMLIDVQQQYTEMDDLSQELSNAFSALKQELPEIEIPAIYTQVGSFDQSIVVGNGTLGISLDKYLGADYPFYQDNYTIGQRKMMTREMIVPDCLGFYILSLYPMALEEKATQEGRDMHMACIQWLVNKVVKEQVFANALIETIDKALRHDNTLTIRQLLTHERSWKR